MCGIFGCLSQKPQNLIQKTLQGLKILEYRGYDSVGIAYTTLKRLKTIKAVGTVEKLTPKIPSSSTTTKACIGHTRWATNGAVNLQNSHPHLSTDGTIAVVHNGIIENYTTCIKELRAKNIKLKTSVDTEVIPNILCYLCHNKHDIHNFLNGQYVFCALEKKNNNLFLAKKGNLPLFIGRDKQTYYVTSDTLALPQTVTQIISMEDLETCEIKENQLFFYRLNHQITKPWQAFSQSSITTDKNGFSTYMEKEINEIPVVIQRIANTYQNDQTLTQRKQSLRNQLKFIKCIHLCGCGTSYHAALIIAKIIERDLHLRTVVHVSSELTESALLHEPALAIVISQSGETADTITCMELLKKHNLPIVALCNVTTSTIAKHSQMVFPLLCGPEIAVASTKVFCAAILVGCLLINDYPIATYDTLIKNAKQILKTARQIIPKPIKIPQRIFILGKNIDYVLALEAALKIKEVTYLHCEGYPANELKHGPLSMVDDSTLALVFGNQSANAIAEITARGGHVITIPPYDANSPLDFINQIIPAQIFALDLARTLGYDPDKPRNLAKSVTVL